jgi:antitoxin (DNA-binding transcriptional repressor) of toxin-antitoxin stability system
MHTVDPQEARVRLDELMDEAAAGEEVVIARGDGATFRIVPVLSTPDDVEAAYAAMAADTEREAAASEWAEGLIGDERRN